MREKPSERKLSAEDIVKQYSSTMDSVNLIAAVKPERMSDEDWASTVKRNKEHIALMLTRDFWTTEDLTPFKNAIK